MFQDRYYVDKLTATPADTLTAFGFATVLAHLMEYQGYSPTITVRDNGSHYAVELDTPVSEAWLENISIEFPFLAAGKSALERPELPRFHYEREKQKRDEYFAEQQALIQAQIPRDQEQWAELRQRAPHPLLPFYIKINQLSAITAHNKIAEQWYDNRGVAAAQIKLLLRLFAQTPNPLEEIIEQWKQRAKAEQWAGSALASALQVVNPGMGKGLNRPKADANIAPDSIDTFWLLEWLKYLGAPIAMIPRTVRGAKDRKSYILEPKGLTYQSHRRLFDEFQSVMFASTHIKMDILAVLRWMKVYLGAQLQGAGEDEIRLLFGEQPDDYVRGLWAVTYKDLGSAFAVINVSLLQLPRWMRSVENSSDAQRYIEIIDEHRRVVEVLEERNSDAYDLLRLYRDFLSGASLEAFFAFCGGYSSHLLQRMERGQFAPGFTFPLLEELFMAHQESEKLSGIVKDSGFRNVARAIRHSTVLAQWAKVRSKRDASVKAHYEIRYGLGQRLLQKSRYRQDLLQELTQFLHDYLQETGRVYERSEGTVSRPAITWNDLDRVVALIDQYDAPTVAGLLVAYGYARDSKESTQEAVESTTDSESEAND